MKNWSATKEIVISVTSFLLATAFAEPVNANLAISAGATANMSCASGVCTATAANAVLNVNQLQAMLAAGNVTVAADASAANIFIDHALSWSSSNTLTLDAYHSIKVNQSVSSTGSGGMTLTINDGGTGGELFFETTGSIGFWSLSAPLTINSNSYTLVDNIATLASDIAGNPNGFYALAASYNAKPDGDYAAAPIPTTFTGKFEGLGNTVSNLSIVDTTNVGNIGFFSDIGSSSIVENLNISNFHIHMSKPAGRTSANVGGLAGSNEGHLLNLVVSGRIGGTNGTKSVGSSPQLTENVGGLVGINNGRIKNSSASITLSSGGYSNTGGLVGLDQSTGTITNSHAEGSLVSLNQRYAIAGGLVGLVNRSGPISYSYASVNISSKDALIGYAGGLVGWLEAASINNSYATGSISQVSDGGGLLGTSYQGAISECYATGNVTGTISGPSVIGGLVGNNQGTINASFATGSVTAGDNSAAGGLVGFNNEFGMLTVNNSYATGNVIAGSTSEIGGLVGRDGNGQITASYATGSPTTTGSGTYIGGFLGEDLTSPGSITNSYWDTTTSGITASSQGAGNIGNDPGIIGATTARAQAGLPPGFNSSIWAENPSINGGLPYLLANPPPG